MKFIAIAALAATASAAEVASGAACTKDDKCTTADECCGDLKPLATAPTASGEANLPAAAKICFTKTATSWSKKWDPAPSTKPPGFGTSDTVDNTKTYKATFACLATGAQALAASAVLAASYYMA